MDHDPIHALAVPYALEAGGESAEDLRQHCLLSIDIVLRDGRKGVSGGEAALCALLGGLSGKERGRRRE
jgi:hypothetical protein